MTDETQAEAPVEEASSTLPPVLVPEVVHEGEKSWESALVVAGGSKSLAGESRPVIVAETRNDDGTLGSNSYPANAEVYFRSGDTEDSATFGKNANVVTLGVDLEQDLTSGFSFRPGAVHVGPAHPAYAAANLAYLKGAREIEIRGLSDLWKERLQPWFDELKDHISHPADVKITLT